MADLLSLTFLRLFDETFHPKKSPPTNYLHRWLNLRVGLIWRAMHPPHMCRLYKPSHAPRPTDHPWAQNLPPLGQIPHLFLLQDPIMSPHQSSVDLAPRLHQPRRHLATTEPPPPSDDALCQQGPEGAPGGGGGPIGPFAGRHSYHSPQAPRCAYAGSWRGGAEARRRGTRIYRIQRQRQAHPASAALRGTLRRSACSTPPPDGRHSKPQERGSAPLRSSGGQGGCARLLRRPTRTPIRRRSVSLLRVLTGGARHPEAEETIKAGQRDNSEIDALFRCLEIEEKRKGMCKQTLVGQMDHSVVQQRRAASPSVPLPSA